MADINSSIFSETDSANNSGLGLPSFAEGMAPSLVDDSARALMGAVRREFDRSHPTINSGGSANTLTLTYDVPPTALLQGDVYSFIASNSNTGACTLDVGLGPINIVNPNGAALGANEILGGGITTVAFDGTNFQLIGFGSAPLTVGQGGTGQTSIPLGDVLVGNNSAGTTNVAPGTAGQALLSTGSGALPVFGPIDLGNPASYTGTLPVAAGGTGTTSAVGVAGGGTGGSTFPVGGLLVGDGTGPLVALSTGTAGEVLTSNGPGVDPSFQPSGTAEVNILTSDVVYYLNASAGNDSNDGLTTITPWATFAHATAVLEHATVFSGNQIILKLAAGTYTQSFYVTTGNWSIVSESGDPTDTILNTSTIDIDTVGVSGSATVTLTNITLIANPSGIRACVACNQKGTTTMAGVNIGTAGGPHIAAFDGGYIAILGNYNVFGNAAFHWSASRFGIIAGSDTALPIGITSTGTIAFTAFAVVSTLGLIKSSGLSIGGFVATGDHFSISENGVITTAGGLTAGPTTYFPGNAAGVVATGGQYD